MAGGSFSSFDPTGEGKWEIYYQKFMFHCQRQKIGTDALRKAELISISSDDMFEFMESVCETSLSDEALTFAMICTKIEAHLQTGNVIMLTAEFNTRSQLPGESISEYITVLRKMAKPCEFGTACDRNIRDRLVVGVRSMDTRALLFRGGNQMTSEEAFQIAKSVEMSQQNAAKTENGHGLHKVAYSKNYEKNNNSEKNNKKSKCWRCGRGNHKPNECHFIKTVCRFCNVEGHIEKACITKKKGGKKTNPPSAQPSKVHQVTVEPHGQQVPPNNAYSEAGPSWANEYNEYSLGAMQVEVNINKVGILNIPPPIMFQAVVDGKIMEFETDCGSPIALISEAIQEKRWPGKKLEKSPLRLATWTKSPVTIKGYFWVKVSHNNCHENLPLFVGYGEGTSLLGRQWFDFLGIAVTVHNQVNKVNVTEGQGKLVAAPVEQTPQELLRYECFQPGLGEYKGKPISLKIDTTVKPKRCKARKVPFARRRAVEQVIDSKVAQGVWKGPLQSAEYSTPIVAVFQDKALPRLCGDYRATAN
ncbi:uncharacterized protein LOC113214137 [Frankliniella occidentalis]|uniref:Uncharacterized protein LOC113214137 n=1 Tax=Frankliniella occidentalis TaxID=133901 RepID=A0A6J1TEC0_FRAOC|nr:uncharacterized protein LOC113214137 [Frankliniella occidentalis]